MYQRVEIIGRLGQDPEIRHSRNGEPIARLSVATDKRWKNRDTGAQESKTEWHRCVAFKRTAEIIGEYLRKGSLVFIAGELETSSYEKDGIKRYSTSIIVQELKMLGEKGGGGGRQQGGEQYAGRPEDRQTLPDDDFDDDIPF